MILSYQNPRESWSTFECIQKKRDTNKLKKWIRVWDDETEEVDEIVYLGAKASKDGGGTEDTKNRLKKARGDPGVPWQSVGIQGALKRKPNSTCLRCYSVQYSCMGVKATTYVTIVKTNFPPFLLVSVGSEKIELHEENLTLRGNWGFNKS